MNARVQVAVVGGGPAGLRAAEVAVGAGARVAVYDAMPSVGRKFLVAGKGGLNLTHSEPEEAFARRYAGLDQVAGLWEGLLAGFSPQAVCEWVESFGLETMVASSGRVYPKGMKAAPLLRRWVARLRESGVTMEMRHRLEEIGPGSPVRLAFDGGRRVSADAVVLALGGGSWPQTGSDGAWVDWLGAMGVRCAPLAAANSGWEVDWPGEVLDAAEGLPLKNLRASAAGEVVEGELLVTRYGLEGGIVYRLGATLRGMETPELVVDFKPTFTVEELVAKVPGGKGGVWERAACAWKLGRGAAAVLRGVMGEEAGQELGDPRRLAERVKACRIRLLRPRPLVEAISSAGGVAWASIDAETLELRDLPGVFVAGEMMDWEAPTGGYLLQGCLATGTRAGLAAARSAFGRMA